MLQSKIRLSRSTVAVNGGSQGGRSGHIATDMQLRHPFGSAPAAWNPYVSNLSSTEWSPL